MAAPWERFAASPAPRQAPDTSAPAEPATGSAPWQRYTPSPGFKRGVKTLEGDTIDVQHTGMQPTVAGKINGRVVQGQKYIPGEKGAAGFGTRVKAAFTHDIEAKKRIYAKARGIDPSLYRTLQGGELAFPDANGVYHLENPPSAGSTLKEMGARTVSDAPIIVGETVGAVYGGVPGQAAGAAAGEIVKRGAARLFLDEKQSVLDDYVLRPITTGVVSGIAGTVGKLAGPGVDMVNKARRGLQGAGQVGRIVKNREAIDAGETVARIERADRFGIRPDTARATQSDMLGAVQQDLGAESSTAGRIIRAKDAQTRGQVKAALEEGKGGLPVLTRDTQAPGEALVKGAQEIKSGLEKGRKSQAKRLYERAFKEAKNSTIDTAQTVELIKSRLGEAGTKEERAELIRWGEDLMPGAFSPPGAKDTFLVNKTYNVQEKLKGTIKSLIKGETKNEDLAYTLGEVRDELLNQIDNVPYGKPINPSAATSKLKEALNMAETSDQRALVIKYIDDLEKGIFKQESPSSVVSDITKLHNIQSRMRVKAEQLAKSGDGDLANKIGDIRQSLLESIGQVSPSYKAASQAYKYRMRAIENFEGEFQNSLLNGLSKIEGDYVHRAPAKLFGAESSPKLIARTKAAFLSGSMKMKNGRVVPGAEGEKMWGAIKRGALADTVEKLDETLTIPTAAMDKLKAALTPKEYEAVKVFRQVLDDLRYVPWSKRGPRPGQGQRILQEEVSGAAGALKRLTLSPYIQSREWSRIRIGKAAPKIAKELTTGDGIKKILSLKQLSPKSREFAKTLSGILGSQLGRDVVARVRED